MRKQAISKRSLWLMRMLVVLALALAACQPAATPTEPAAQATSLPATTAPTQAPTTAAFTEPTVGVVEDASLGPILVDGEGMTLYGFTKDAPNKSNCSGGCLAAWPPLVTEGSPVAGEGVDASMLGAADMPDGTQIVTYNGMPLYYWASDTKPGDTTGQDVNKVWYVVSPEGQMMVGKDVPITGAAGEETAKGTLNVAEDPTLGKFLVDEKGMTLYMYTKDEPNQVNCSGDCLKAWPPLLVEGEPTAGAGVDADLLGTADLPDGTKIVTYNQMPLYLWVQDTKPGDTTGQDVGKVWYVVAPDGSVVKQDGSAANENESNDNESASDDVKLRVANHPTLGNILVDDRGMTLYMFTKDAPNQSNCTGECLKAWPPMLATRDTVGAEDGVNEAMVGVAPMTDGTQIVTYNGMPLYYWAGDTKPGDATGQGVNTVWYVVDPDGNPVQ
jgi:predicted lipoprotein with Yx(FWY)xxD motif